MRRGNKSVIGVLPRVQYTHAIEFPEESGGQEVIDGEGIVRMPPQYLVKLLHRAVIVEVVEMIERGQVEWIMWTVGQRFGYAGYLRRSHHHLKRNQGDEQNQSGALGAEKRQLAFVKVRCTLV